MDISIPSESYEDINNRLLKAAGRGDVEEVRELLRCEGADVHYYRSRVEYSGYEKTAIIVACKAGHKEVVRILLDHCELTKEEMESVFFTSETENRVDIMEMLIERGFDPSVNDNWAITASAYCGRVEMVELLLRHPNVDPSAKNNYPVYWASRNGMSQVLKRLLQDDRVNAYDRDKSPIKYALSSSVDVLIQDDRFGISVDREIFEREHPDKVKKYDKLASERSARKWASLWCMKELGGEENSWSEIMWPFSDRFEKIVLDFRETYSDSEEDSTDSEEMSLSEDSS